MELFSKKESRASFGFVGYNNCVTCGLSKYCKTPQIPIIGSGSGKILVLIDSPTEKEDLRGKLLSGSQGAFFKQFLKKVGLLEEEIVIASAVFCHISKKSKITKVIQSCQIKLISLIKKLKPRLIITFGDLPLKVLYENRWQKGLGFLDRWVGYLIPDFDLQTFVLPIWGRDYLFNFRKYKEIEVLVKYYIGKAKENALQLYKIDYTSKIKIIEGVQPVRKLLLHLLKQEIIAFDLETTGLKPYKPGHSIEIISFAISPNQAFVIPFPNDIKNLKLLRRIMEKPIIKKVAHNMKYENLWMRQIVGIQVKGWFWDSMQAAHLLNNIPGTVGLKFQTFVNFGVYDYDSDIEDWLKSKDEKDSNALNQIRQIISNPINRHKMMLYCGLDSLFTFKLMQKQRKELGYE